MRWWLVRDWCHLSTSWWSRMPSSKGFSTLSLAWCRPTITITLSGTHSNALHWSGGRRFPMSLGAVAPTDAKSRAESVTPRRYQQWPTLTYKLWEWSSLEHGLESWDNGARVHFWMFSCFSLLFSSSLDLGTVQIVSTWVFSTSQWMWSFPVRRIRRKLSIELYQSGPGLVNWSEYVRSLKVPCFLRCTRVQFMQPRRSAHKERDNVMARCDSGQVKAILYSQLALWLSSLEIILPVPQLTLSRVHVGNRISWFTIRMPTGPNTGVRALTDHWKLVSYSIYFISIVYSIQGHSPCACFWHLPNSEYECYARRLWTINCQQINYLYHPSSWPISDDLMPGMHHSDVHSHRIAIRFRPPATPHVSVINDCVFHRTPTALTEPRTLWQRCTPLALLSPRAALHC